MVRWRINKFWGRNKYGKSLDDFILNCLAYFFSGLVLVSTLYPLVYVLSASFSDPIRVAMGELLLFPVGLSMEGYKLIFDYDPIWIGYRNTVFYTIAGTMLNLIVTLPCAYSLSRKDFKGRDVIMAIFVFTTFFSGGIIPTYLLMKNLHLINTIWAMLIPGAVSVFNLIITRTFFQQSIPYELQEAALIDGCRNLRLFLSIILPLSMPIISVISLYYAVGHWNSFFNALIYLSNDRLYPLQLYLRNILLVDMTDDIMMGADSEEMEALIRRLQQKETMKYGLVVVSSLPVLILYPLLQKYFVKGIMIGALKG
jgi:putative aldouronate transport system permease protein